MAFRISGVGPSTSSPASPLPLNLANLAQVRLAPTIMSAMLGAPQLKTMQSTVTPGEPSVPDSKYSVDLGIPNPPSKAPPAAPPAAPPSNVPETQYSLPYSVPSTGCATENFAIFGQCFSKTSVYVAAGFAALTVGVVAYLATRKSIPVGTSSAEVYEGDWE